MEFVKAGMYKHSYRTESLKAVKDFITKNRDFENWTMPIHKEFIEILNSQNFTEILEYSPYSTDLRANKLYRRLFSLPLPNLSDGTPRSINVSHYIFNMDNYYTFEFHIDYDEIWYLGEEEGVLCVYILKRDEGNHFVNVKTIGL